MIWVTFWELSPSVEPRKVAEVAAKLTQKGLWPPKSVKILGWYICPGGKGVTVSESEGADGEAAFRSWVAWEREMPGLFASYQPFPAISAEQAVKIALE